MNDARKLGRGKELALDLRQLMMKMRDHVAERPDPVEGVREGLRIAEEVFEDRLQIQKSAIYFFEGELLGNLVFCQHVGPAEAREGRRLFGLARFREMFADPSRRMAVVELLENGVPKEEAHVWVALVIENIPDWARTTEEPLSLRALGVAAGRRIGPGDPEVWVVKTDGFAEPRVARYVDEAHGHPLEHYVWTLPTFFLGGHHAIIVPLCARSLDQTGAAGAPMPIGVFFLVSEQPEPLLPTAEQGTDFANAVLDYAVATSFLPLLLEQEARRELDLAHLVDGPIAASIGNFELLRAALDDVIAQRELQDSITSITWTLSRLRTASLAVRAFYAPGPEIVVDTHGRINVAEELHQACRTLQNYYDNIRFLLEADPGLTLTSNWGLAWAILWELLNNAFRHVHRTSDSAESQAVRVGDEEVDVHVQGERRESAPAGVDITIINGGLPVPQKRADDIRVALYGRQRVDREIRGSLGLGLAFCTEFLIPTDDVLTVVPDSRAVGAISVEPRNDHGFWEVRLLLWEAL